MRLLLTLWAALSGGTDEEPSAGEPEPARPARDYGLQIRFAPHSSFRSLLANAIFAALIEQSEILWFYPNFVIAEDGELERFTLTVRTTRTWDQLVAATYSAVSPEDISEVVQVDPCYEDEVQVPAAPQSDGTRDVGLEVHFGPQAAHQALLANAVYAALLRHGEVVWFYPNFVIADDAEFAPFSLTLRTAAPWDALVDAVMEAATAPTDIRQVREVTPRYEDPAPAPREEPSSHPAPPPPGPESLPGTAGGEMAGHQDVQTHSIRVDLDRLDNLSSLIGELAVERAELTDILTRMEAVCVEGGARTLVQELRRAVGKLSGTSGQLQEQATELRMVPVAQLFGRFNRLVRDLSASTGKRLVLRREGEETMLDKTIVEEMVDPLLHLVRNAADHGIEPGEERLRAGKPEVGAITLRAYDQGDQVVIEVADDGKGINVERVKAKALERELITADQAAAMTDHELIQLIFLPGFSTAAQVTDISGRGVGMDVVKTNVEKLRGTLHVQSDRGEGTRFVIRLPLTVSILQVMMAEVAGQVVAVPLTSLQGMARLAPDSQVLWGQAVDYQNRIVPQVDLGQVWHNRPAGGEHMLVMQAGAQEIALLINRPIGQGEVVIKPLGDYIGRLPGVAGSAILADGRIALILDGATLVSRQSTQEGVLPRDAARSA